MALSTHEEKSETLRYLRIIEGTVVIVAALYFGRPFLLPVAMAVLLAFLLAPTVTWIERHGIHRVLSVGVVVLLIVFTIGFAGWKITEQLTDLAIHLPEYRENLEIKIHDFKKSGKGALFKIGQTVSEVSAEIKEAAQKPDGSQTNTKSKKSAPIDPPQLVQVVPEPTSTLSTAAIALTSLSGPLGTASVVLVLVIFMLLGREDLRNRFVRLAGTQRVTLTTITLDDLGRRISRYLLMNTLVNGGFGIVVFIVLQLLGVHYALVWGFLAASLRFVPYAGPILASLLPIGMAVIQFPSWGQAGAVVLLFIILELITNSIVEPLVYGRSAGISTLSLLLAAVFWTWIWGPVGLVLSVPLTVMVAVLGKYIPPLEPLWILLGDEPALPPYVQYYQRLLAGDADEAAIVVEEYRAAHSVVEVQDDVLIPALALAERDRDQGDVADLIREFIWESTAEVLDDLNGTNKVSTEKTAESERQERMDPAHGQRPIRIVGIPAQDKADELALVMLSQVLPKNVELQICPLETPPAQLLDSTGQQDLLCVSALGPGDGGRTRYLCKRLRQRFPKAEIIVARWGFQGDREKLIASATMRGASRVILTLTEAIETIDALRPCEIPKPTLADELAIQASPV